MWNHRLCQHLLLFIALIILPACTSLYSDSIAEFNKGMTTAKAIIIDRATAMDAVKRRKELEKMFYGNTKIDLNDPEQKKRLQEFSSLICSSSDFLKNQRSAAATLEIYNQVLLTTNAKPKEEIGSIVSSIWDNWQTPTALKPRDWILPDSKLCVEEIQNLMTIDRGEIPEFAVAAIPALVDAAGKVVDVLKKVAVTSLGLVDDAVRARKIKAYVLESREVVQVQLDRLNETDGDMMKYCAKISYGRPCRREQPTPKPPTKLDAVTVAQKWAVLQKPWHLFLAMQSTEAAYKQAHAGRSGIAPDPGPYWYLLDKQQDELNEALKEYQTLAATVNVGDVGRAMQNANDTLVALAEGHIPPEKAWGMLKDFASRVKAIADEVKSLKDASSTLSSKVAALNEG